MGLRIDLAPGGCCGTHYRFAVSGPVRGDIQRGSDRAPVYLAPEAAALLQGATIDWGPALKPPRFRVLRNGNTACKCPCGRSFGRPYPGKPTPGCQAYVPMPWDADERR